MDVQTLIAKAASDHGLPAGLVAATVAVESGGDPFACRFEPQFFERYVRPRTDWRAVRPCSLDTERQSLATSWGLMQVMGATARDLGFTGPYLSTLCDPPQGLEYGCRLLARLRDRHKAALGWPGVVAAYNAGSPRRGQDGRFVNQAYVDRIAQALGEDWPS
jgi:soluble lytic murein transglycosylase-like protein